MAINTETEIESSPAHRLCTREGSLVGRTRLAELFHTLDQSPVPLSKDQLLEQLSGLELTIDDVRPWMNFSPNGYVRNLVHDRATYQALLLCWRNGQRSPIHDHAGSACGVLVVHGTVTETIFDRAPNGMIMGVESLTLTEGEVCASVDQNIHQISNLQANSADLVTLHIYSPPLRTMGTYSLTDAQVRHVEEPIFIPEWCDGAGI